MKDRIYKRARRLGCSAILLWCLIPLHETLAQDSWQWVNPRPQGMDILGVQVLNNSTVVAAAAYGNILKSTDAGESWRVLYGGTPATLNSVWFVNQDTGFAVGNHGAIVMSSDGGESWVQQPTVVVNRLWSVCFTTGIGIAVGDLGTILRTTDGGASWTTSGSGTNASLHAVSFADEMIGFIVGSGGAILRTTDGGISWNPQTSSADRTLRSVLVLDTDHAVAVGDYGTIVATTNGGTVWNPAISSTTGDLYSICRGNAQTWFACSPAALLKTTDEGLTWTPGGAGGGYGISFHTDMGVIVGSMGSILVTTDGGSSWIQQKNTVASGFLFDVTFSSPTNCVAVGNDALLRSTDAGSTWISYPQLPIHSQLLAVNFVNDTTGYISGGSVFYRTTDGGGTWTQLQTEGVYAADMFFTDESTGTAVGGSIYHTTNAGYHWTLQGDQSFTFTTESQMVTPRFGIAVAQEGLIKTMNGGATWRAFPNPFSKQTGVLRYVYGVYFSNELVGTILGWSRSEGPGIVRTTDGGVTWTEKYNSEWSGLKCVSFSGKDRGIAVGEDGKIFRTTDGGNTWEQTHSGVLSRLYHVLMVDSTIAVAVGTQATILRTSDGGATWTTIMTGSGTGEQFYSISFPTHDTGYVLEGNNGSLLRTTDSGISWAPFSGGLCGVAASSVFFTSQTRGFILCSSLLSKTTDGGTTWHTVSGVSGGSTISFADSGIGIIGGPLGDAYRTTDGGDIWTYSPTDVLTAFSAVSFAGRDTGVAVGGTRVVRTTDGGINWTSQETGISSNLLDVVMVTSDRGIAVGTGGTIVRSTSGGESWFPVDSKVTESLVKVSFGDSQHGTILGQYGVILRTTDGGESWAHQRNAPAGPLNSVSFQNADIGIIVGTGGTILKTINGSVTTIHPPPHREAPAPQHITLLQNYPNPFNPVTTIEFDVPSASSVTLRVFDLLGREVKVLVNEKMEPGRYSKTFEGRDLASGVYFYRLEAGKFVQTRKLVLLR